MSYDLGSLYSSTLTSNYLSKTIVDMLLKDSRFSSVSKITLPYEYGTSVSEDPIGYDETGKPIYESNVSITQSDDMKAAITKMHDRNNDTALRGAGTNIVENTSSGNIAEFRSNGSIKAMITELGRFTGTIRLENIEDLANITLDTTNFYKKADVNNLLSAKVSKADLYGSTGKILSTLLDVDIVRVIDLTAHTTDTVKHVTSADKVAWTAKYDKPIGGISFNDLNTTVVDRINASALASDLSAHTINDVKHVTAADKTTWNAKYDKPSTGIPETDMSEHVQLVLDSAVATVTYTAHTIDNERHTNTVERSLWNAKYNKPGTGIPETDLEMSLADKIDGASTKDELAAHAADKVLHATVAEKNVWNAKYDKPSVGIPESDFTDAVRTKFASFALQTSLSAHATDMTLHLTDAKLAEISSKYSKPSTGIPENDLDSAFRAKVSAKLDTTIYDDHVTDTVKHVSQTERDIWNAKYAKSVSGIPETDLTVVLQNKLASYALSADVIAHTTDTVLHVTAANKTAWTAKYDKPVGGIPETDLTVALTNKLASYALSADLLSHTTDTVKHVTAEDKTAWTAKYDKPSTGIPETDFATAVKDKLASYALATDVTTHTTDAVRHITADERTAWTAKYVKAVDGIPETDLTVALQNKLASYALSADLTAHVNDVVKHITSVERTAWTAKYDKPVSGIPETDLTSDLTTKLASYALATDVTAHINDAVKHITADERTAWTAKYVKPETGIPETDFATAVADKINSIVTPFAKTIAVEAAATTFTIAKTEHNVTHTNAYEYLVKAFSVSGNVYTEVTPSSFVIDGTSSDITVTFGTSFSGTIVIR